MSALKLGAKVLCNWQPSELDQTRVWDEWLKLVRRLCGTKRPLRNFTQVRWPGHGQSHGYIAWHTDSAGVHARVNGPHIYLLMWSNILPTMVRLADGSRLKTKRGDVLLLDNDLVQHRTDRRVGKNGGKRWFARAMIAKR